jgi:hypothetical protein
MFRLAMIVLITALSCEIGFAQEDRGSANYRMEGCRDVLSGRHDGDLLDPGICIGLVRGLVYADPTLCIPDGVTNGQKIRVVVQYIGQRPARMHESFNKLATEALRGAWPCKTRQ